MSDDLKIGDLKNFVETCREHNIDDNKIVNMAISTNKWDKNLIEAFVLTDNQTSNTDKTTNTIEKSSTNKNKTSNNKPENGWHRKQRPQLPAIFMVIHHISLWFFLLTAVPLILALINLIVDKESGFFSSSGSFETLISFIVVLFVTGGLYGGLFLNYFKKLKNNPDLQTGRIFSLINIAFSLITVIGSTIVLIVTLVNYLMIGSVEDDFPAGTILSALSLIILYGSIFITYFASDFMTPSRINEKKEKIIEPRRKTIMLTSFLTSFVLLLVLLIISFSILPSIMKDSRTASHVSSIVKEIHNNAEENGELMTVEEVNNISQDYDLNYRILNDYEYIICADFETDTIDNSYSYSEEDKKIDDSYTYRIDYHTKGEHCFTFYNQTLKEEHENYFNNSDISIGFLDSPSV